MKTIERLHPVVIVLIVSAISFLVTFFGDWVFHVVLSVALGAWFGLTLARPSPMDQSWTPCHLRAIVGVLPVFIIHVGMQFLVNELTRRGFGYSLSGLSPLVETPWAALSALAFAVTFLWGRTHLKVVY